MTEMRLGIAERVILKYILKRKDVKMWTGFKCLITGSVAGRDKFV
jgi:hypothetical protein